VTVRTNALTRFEDHSDADLPRFSLADLRAGDYVELSAYDDGGGLLASLLERDDADDRLEVEGPASAVAAPEFTIAGIRITTTTRLSSETTTVGRFRPPPSSPRPRVAR